MKKLLMLSFLLASLGLYAQEQNYVETKPNCVLYEVPSDVSFPASVRNAFDATHLKSKKVKKTTSLPIIDLTNLNKSTSYDAYVVEYSGKYYFVRSADIFDNSYLEKRSSELTYEYEAIKDSSARYNAIKNEAQLQLASTIDSIAEFYQTDVSIYKSKGDSIIAERIKVSVQNEIQDDILNYQERREVYYNWVSSLPTSIQKDAKALAIPISVITVGYYGTCEYKMVFVNMSSKTIKYLKWSGKVRNAVGDFVSYEVNHTSSFSGKYTGPCEGYYFDDGIWEPVLFNSSAKEMVLSSVKIVYAEGSSITIGKSSLDVITNIPKEALEYSEKYAGYRMCSYYEDKSYSEKARKDKMLMAKGKVERDFYKDLSSKQYAVNKCREAKRIILDNSLSISSKKNYLLYGQFSFLWNDPSYKRSMSIYEDAYIKATDITRSYMSFKKQYYGFLGDSF